MYRIWTQVTESISYNNNYYISKKNEYDAVSKYFFYAIGRLIRNYWNLFGITIYQIWYS